MEFLWLQSYNSVFLNAIPRMQYTVDGFSSFLAIATLLSLLYPLLGRMLAPKVSILSYSVFVLHSTSIGILIYLRLVDDFSFENVYNYSHTLQPLLYKIAGLWGNYEGSFLLFVWFMSAYTALLEFSLSSNGIRVTALSIQHLLLFCFSAFCLVFANPLLRVFALEEEGLGFNPLLQDIGLSIHPPVLFSGYAGFSPVLSIALAALVEDMSSDTWSKMLRSWALFAWSLLTLGVALGGWWAYRVLGWGGFWSWDPVENVSLLPWLIGTALIHMLPVVRKSGIYCNFTLFLAISSFLCCLYSTFLVRSGFLISVHTFANDSTRGVLLLVLITAIVFTSYSTFIVACRNKNEVCGARWISKVSALLAHTCLLLVAFFVVLMGTVYPILLELFTGVSISVGAPYYSSIFCVLLIALLCILIALPGLHWSGAQPFRWSFKVSSILAVLFVPVAAWFGILGIMLLLSGFLFSSIIEDFVNKLPNTMSWLALRNALRPGRCAMLLSHLGVAVLAIGAIYSSSMQIEKSQYMKVGDSVNIRQYRVVLRDIALTKKDYYEALVGRFAILNIENDGHVGTISPENRYYRVEATKNVVSSTYHGLWADIYVVIGDPDLRQGVAVKVYYKPLISLVWLGCALLVLGGCFGTYNAWLKLRQDSTRP
ncbi:heme lyase CcmF/NrfE family subunit [Candidatus Anaplasma sp. TIGMIC]|uniref:heme lyase CcmF/NrfE family subunit n=1 Tax=Candidatus Anaplasma sp. TIGMIC TaxID=3020713 RepID=UPI00232E6052|nr:heme lyase CcmF/NrfE family subunit [Candidatus Anaplasma sp. TIGMIC]MDB1135805.1 heme lyase CcmF/NrfE family subunit [Candidatus Anaplasma sp. TIGMIC]